MSADLSAELIGAMVNAVIAGTQAGQTCSRSRAESLRFIMRNADKLDAEKKKSCASMVIISQYGSAVKPCNEGVIVNLDALPDAVLEKVALYIENGL